ncbi:hypothetical protein HYT51_01525 [Candidatus Woesearchaeota archaeon]|nr:hypothetical protein [Candidatus Woesearchaeota archaeon]
MRKLETFKPFGNIRKDKKVIQQINFGQYTARVVEEDRQLVENRYRLDIIDGQGNTIIKTYSQGTPTFNFPSNLQSDSLEKKVEGGLGLHEEIED